MNAYACCLTLFVALEVMDNKHSSAWPAATMFCIFLAYTFAWSHAMTFM